MMDARFDSIEFKSVMPGDEQAKAVTDEVWRYRYVNVRDESLYQPPTRVEYTMEYSLEQTDKGWIIKSTKILSEKETPIADEEQP